MRTATCWSRPTPGRYLDPRYRDRAIRIGHDDEGYEVLVIDGRPLETLRGQLGALGGIEMDSGRLLMRGEVTYAEGQPARRLGPARPGFA